MDESLNKAAPTAENEVAVEKEEIKKEQISLSPAAGKRTYTCKECSFVFMKRSHLLRHQAVHSDERPHVCTVCHKGYRTAYHLNRHAATHTGEKTFKCTYEGCTVACITEWNLKRHVKRTHCDAFNCKVCGKEFKKNKLLKQHMSSEHKNSTVSCEFPGCASIFPNGAKMRHHMKVHQERGYLCPVKSCHEKFPLWSECRMHTAKCKMKESACDVCGKVFKALSNMKAHRKIHSEEREVFACTYEGCGRFYTKQYNLKAHVQSFHMNIRPHICPKKGCNKSFHFPHLLRNHLESIHEKGEKEEGSKTRDKERKKRPQRMKTSTISAVTGYIPELWTRMTPEEVKRYVDGDESLSSQGSLESLSSAETTQQEMSPIQVEGDRCHDLDLDESSNDSNSSGAVPKERDPPSDSSEEFETITELLEINPYIYKPVQRVVRRPHLNHRSSSHTMTSASAAAHRSRSSHGECSSTRTISESSHMEHDECMIINSVDLPPSIKNEQEECMAAFNDRFKLMQSKLSPRVMASIDVNIQGSCHVQSGSESESDPQTPQVQVVA